MEGLFRCKLEWRLMPLGPETLDEPNLMDPPTLPPPTENMHCRERPVNGQITSFLVYQVLYPSFDLLLQPLHPPLLQMWSPCLGSQGLRRHFRPQCLFIQRHHRCLRERVTPTHCPPAVRPNSRTRPCFLQHPHLCLC